MDLEVDPGIFNFEFLLQIVDNDLADITPRSYIVRKSLNIVDHVPASFHDIRPSTPTVMTVIRGSMHLSPVKFIAGSAIPRSSAGRFRNTILWN